MNTLLRPKTYKGKTKSLDEQRQEAERHLTRKFVQFGPGHPEYEAAAQALEAQIRLQDYLQDRKAVGRG